MYSYLLLQTSKENGIYLVYTFYQSSVFNKMSSLQYTLTVLYKYPNKKFSTNATISI